MRWQPIEKYRTPPGDPTYTSTYTYDAANQLRSVNSNNGYTYDANGNMTSEGSKDFVYDVANQLIQVKCRFQSYLTVEFQNSMSVRSEHFPKCMTFKKCLVPTAIDSIKGEKQPSLAEG